MRKDPAAVSLFNVLLGRRDQLAYDCRSFRRLTSGANKDGKLTLEEIMAFMQGARAPASRQ
jgi:hypothetical protein